MLLLSTAFLLLVGAPVSFLVLGRAIARATDFEGRRRAVPAPAVETGEPWYFRRMRPAFKWVDDGETHPSGSEAD